MTDPATPTVPPEVLDAAGRAQYLHVHPDGGWDQLKPGQRATWIRNARPAAEATYRATLGHAAPTIGQAEHLLAQLAGWSPPVPHPADPRPDPAARVVDDWTRAIIPTLTRLVAAAMPTLRGLAEAAYQQGRLDGIAATDRSWAEAWTAGRGDADGEAAVRADERRTVAEEIAAEIKAERDEQADLMTRRKLAGHADEAREHATRARAFHSAVEIARQHARTEQQP